MSEDHCYADQGSYGFFSNNNAGSGLGNKARYDYQNRSGVTSGILNKNDYRHKYGIHYQPLSAPQIISHGHNANSGYFSGIGGGANSGDKRKEYAMDIGILIAGGLAMFFCANWLLNFVRNMAE